MTTEIVFKIVKHDSEDYKNAVTLREAILRKPLGLTFHSEQLALEKNQIHIVGVIDNTIIATAVLVPEGEACKMQQVAVSPHFQNKNIGTRMMLFCEKQAIILGFKQIYCHARKTAVNFYLNNGYVPEGDYFEQVTIPHLKMRKVLSRLDPYR